MSVLRNAFIPTSIPMGMGIRSSGKEEEEEEEAEAAVPTSRKRKDAGKAKAKAKAKSGSGSGSGSRVKGVQSEAVSATPAVSPRLALELLSAIVESNKIQINFSTKVTHSHCLSSPLTLLPLPTTTTAPAPSHPCIRSCSSTDCALAP